MPRLNVPCDLVVLDPPRKGCETAVLEAIEKLWLIFAGDTPLAALIDYLFAPVITMAILIAVGYAVRKYLPKLWSVLNGIIPN